MQIFTRQSFFMFTLYCLTMNIGLLSAMQQEDKKNTILITMYGGPEGFAKEQALKPKDRAVSNGSFLGIKDLIKKYGGIEIREGLPDPSDCQRYSKCIHIQPGGNMHRQYNHNLNMLHAMRRLFCDFVKSGGYYIGVCAGALLVAPHLTYFSHKKQEYVSFNYDWDQYSLYPYEMKIPEWPGKDWTADQIPLKTINGLLTKYFSSPVFVGPDNQHPDICQRCEELDSIFFKSWEDSTEAPFSAVENWYWDVLDGAYFESTRKIEPIVIRNRNKHITLISTHYEFRDQELANLRDQSCQWLYNVIMGTI
jgi:hypothetical protein